MPEDSMELSSDFNRQRGTNEDIEIDLDLTGDDGQDLDDDYMIEDAKSEAGADNQAEGPPSVNDDLMLDDDTVSQTMQDDVTLPDEELYDVEVLEHDESNATLTGLVGDDLSQDLPLDATEPGLSAQEQEHDLVDHPLHQVEEHVVLLEVDSTDLQREEVARPQAQDTEPHLQEPTVLSPESVPQPAPSGQEQSSPTVESVPQTQTLSLDIVNTIHEESENSYDLSNVGQQISNTDDVQHETIDEIHSVHPVIVVYQGTEMSLFPPSDQGSDTYFLQDETLAHRSISDLLQACRSVLADDVGEDDEVIITMAELSLQISEDSTYAPTISLSQILDIHVQLLQQDGVDNPDPLYMSLTTKMRFAKRFSDLTTAVAEGKGMSQIQVWDDQGEQDYDTTGQLHDDTNGESVEDEDDHGRVESEDAAQETATSAIGHDQTNDNTVQSEFPVPPVLESEQVESELVKLAKVRGDQQAESGKNSPKTNDHSHGVKNKIDPTTEEPAQCDTLTSRATNEESFESNHQHAPSIGEDVVGEDDLVDYSDEEYDAEKTHSSTETSTLKGDDPQSTNGISELFFDTCYRPDLCFCSICNESAEEDPLSVNEQNPPGEGANSLEDNNHVSPTEEQSTTGNARPTGSDNSESDVQNDIAGSTKDDQGNGDEQVQYDEGVEEDFEDRDLEPNTLGSIETREDLKEPGDDAETVTDQLASADVNRLAHVSSIRNADETSEQVSHTNDSVQYIDETQGEETNGEYRIGRAAFTNDQVQAGSEMPDTGANEAGIMDPAGDSTSGNLSQLDEIDLSGDEDEVNYDEDEDEVVTPNGKSESGIGNRLKQPNENLNSSKRSHDESLEQDENDSGSQGLWIILKMVKTYS
ncbi:MAG: hypothetical protein M1836_001701 [Candelina mexicana]|nr:MAG: hypothetical protein M1836_001701 [Candelina mexicana]